MLSQKHTNKLKRGSTKEQMNHLKFSKKLGKFDYDLHFSQNKFWEIQPILTYLNSAQPAHLTPLVVEGKRRKKEGEENVKNKYIKW